MFSFTRSSAVALLAVLVAACDSPTEPPTEVESYEFSAMMERTGHVLIGLVAHHEVGAMLEPTDFRWPASLNFEVIGRWEPSEAPAHSLGVPLGFGVQAGSGKFAVEWRLEWLNGETPKPFNHSVTAIVLVERSVGSAIEKVNTPFTFQRVGPNRYRAEVTVPSAAADWYNIYIVPAVTVRCNAEGIKSLLVSDVNFSGAWFGHEQHEGSVLFTGTCRRGPVPRYSVVPAP